MEHADVVHRTLEIDRASEPVTGRVTDGPDAEQRFTGWLELFAVIDALREPSDEAEARSCA